MLTIKSEAQTKQAVLSEDGATAIIVQNDKLRANRVLYDRANALIRVDYEHGYVDEAGQFHGSGIISTLNITDSDGAYGSVKTVHTGEIVAFLEAIEWVIRDQKLLQDIVANEMVK